VIEKEEEEKEDEVKADVNTIFYKAKIKSITPNGLVTVMFMKKHQNFDLSLINKNNLDIKINNKKVNLTDWQPVSFKSKYL
jgi:hypothetical protein